MSTAEPMPQRDLETQRAAARRTALVLGLVALAIFAAFLASGLSGPA